MKPNRKRCLTPFLVTVANKNDTDGDGSPDKEATGAILVARTILAPGCDISAGDQTIWVDDVSDFAATVNGAPNRIRVIEADENGNGWSELAYVASVDPVANTITFKSALQNDYNPEYCTVEIGEVDMMRVEVSSPVGTPSFGHATVSVSGNLTLWFDEDGENAAGSAGSVDFDTNDLPVTVWVECEDVSSAVAADWVHLNVYDDSIDHDVPIAQDEVSVTGIWAEHNNFWTACTTPGSLNGGETNADVIDFFEEQMADDLGLGCYLFGQGVNCYGGRIESQFTIYPLGAAAEPAVHIDTAQQIECRYYSILGGEMAIALDMHVDFPYSGWNVTELDDDYTISDTVGTDNHIELIDGPCLSAPGDFLVLRAEFHDFARFKFGAGFADSVAQVPDVQGSRGSDFADWHCTRYLVQVDDTGEEGDYAPDIDNTVSASLPILHGEGDGSAVVDSVDQTWANSAGWEFDYDSTSNTWEAYSRETTDSDGGTSSWVDMGFVTLQPGPVPVWSGDITDVNANTLLTITITSGNVDFDDTSTFVFSTFGTRASYGKVEEVSDDDSEDPIDPDAEDF